MTAVDIRPTVARRRGPLVRTARTFLGVQLALGVWLWGIVAVVAVIITVVFDRVGRVEASTWELLDQGPRWFLFSMAIILVAGYFPAHVANGMTRRSFTAALAVAIALTAVAYAVLTAVGYAVERAVFGGRGWPTDLQSEHLFTSTDQLGAVTLENVVVLVVYAASGMLVGAAYYRVGGWWGTLALPLTVGPVLVAESLVRTSWAGTALEPLLGAVRVPAGVGAGTCLLVAAVLVAVAHLTLRSAPLRTPAG
jgi:hypothetical protein